MSEAVAMSGLVSPHISPMAPPKGVGLVRAWLLLIAGMVYLMILVGGATRLTPLPFPPPIPRNTPR